eukprot:TRINITY_DN165_c0_g2_i4.p1 TRINITY_DN165_c0_g2~~TRINITY_DN165_c0_g2_i4.p1  ORF type:complete len:518 (-),score=183.47 TRINITY_DN165_c0_g2_i4:21-1574(-)
MMDMVLRGKERRELDDTEREREREDDQFLMGCFVETPRADYFYNYYGLGFDILMDGMDHSVKKFVLRTNLPGHYDFNRYNKCNFFIIAPDDGEQDLGVSMSMSTMSVSSTTSHTRSSSSSSSSSSTKNFVHADSHWDSIQDAFGDAGQPLMKSASEKNPFNQTKFYIYDHVVFEIVLKNGHISSVSLFKDPNAESKKKQTTKTQIQSQSGGSTVGSGSGSTTVTSTTTDLGTSMVVDEPIVIDMDYGGGGNDAGSALGSPALLGGDELDVLGGIGELGSKQSHPSSTTPLELEGSTTPVMSTTGTTTTTTTTTMTVSPGINVNVNQMQQQPLMVAQEIEVPELPESPEETPVAWRNNNTRNVIGLSAANDGNSDGKGKGNGNGNGAFSFSSIQLGKKKQPKPVVVDDDQVQEQVLSPGGTDHFPPLGSEPDESNGGKKRAKNKNNPNANDWEQTTDSWAEDSQPLIKLDESVDDFREPEWQPTAGNMMNNNQFAALMDQDSQDSSGDEFHDSSDTFQ